MTTNLEYYRKQAKALLKATQSGDAAALERIHTCSSELALNTAQLTIAREQGFPSWARFKQFIMESRSDRTDLIATFVSAATSDLRRAQAMLASHPDMEKGGFYAALVLGDHRQVRTTLAERPELAVAKSGPEHVEPLIYVCFSRFASPQSDRATARGEDDRLLREAPAIRIAPEDHRLLPDLAISHRATAVRALLAAGVPVDTRGENGATALHWAGWKGYADIVKILLGGGASLTTEDTMFHGTPAGWFGHGIHNCGEGGGDYAEVARELIAEGAAIPAVDFPSGNAEVDRILREHGII